MTHQELLDHPDYLTWVRTLREYPDRALVAADWFDEHGFHERAEFIRVQCEVEVLRDSRDSLGRRIGHTNALKIRPLRSREAELLASHRAEWSSVPRFAPYPQTAEFVNGFPMRWKIPSEDWLRHGDAIYRYHPCREVELVTTIRPMSQWSPAELQRFYPNGLAMKVDLASVDDSARVYILGLRWPGVTFTLPPIGVPESIQAISRRFRAGLAVSLTGGMIDTGSLRPSIPRAVRPTRTPPPDTPAE